MKIVKKILKRIAQGSILIAGLTLLYIILAYLLSRIPININKESKHEIAIYLLTNGVHTDIVLPIKNKIIDWNQKVSYQNTIAKDSTYQYIAFGWGDKGFYLHTPTWADLKMSVALKAAFGLSTSAIHTTYYRNLTENESCKKIMISVPQYQQLIAFIARSFETDKYGKYINIKTNAVYGPDDAFYEAIGSYNLFYTCNTWTNNALKACGQKACLWTPFQSGIFYHYKK